MIVILEVLDFLELLDELSYRMTSFAAAQRMTTAEPPEPFALFAIDVLFLHEVFVVSSARR